MNNGKTGCRKRGIRVRIISQDYKKDFPYEMCTIWICENKVFASPVGEPETEAVMAEYSTQEKALKSLGQMRDVLYHTPERVFCFPKNDSL